MVAAAEKIRTDGARLADFQPMRLTQLLREHAPVCCWLGDAQMWMILMMAELQSRHGKGDEGWTVPQ